MFMKIFLLVVTIQFAISFALGSNIIVERPSNITIDGGNVVTLNCKTSRQAVTVKWMKNNVTLNMTSSRYSFYDNNTLTIHNATHKSGDAGKYECVIMNGSVILERSQPAWVHIRFLEIIVLEEDIKQKLYIGQTYTGIIAHWKAFPKPTISWKGPSAMLPSNSFTVINKSEFISSDVYHTGSITLIISNINSSEYFGNYTIFADTGFEVKSKIFGNLVSIDDCSSSVLLRCGNKLRCIYNERHICDNRNHCGDWSDEVNCTLPVPPENLSANLILYDGVYLRWQLHHQSTQHFYRIKNITTKIEITSRQKIIKTIENYGGTEGFPRNETITGLQNGTTYLIKLRTKTHAGISVNSTSVNVTIPRMVAPSAPRDLSIKLRSKVSSVWVTIAYNRPIDDGGTDYLYGYVKKCRVDEKDLKLLYDCAERFTSIGTENEGQYSFYSLKGETKYHFSVFFQSRVNQNGTEASITYTTPSTGLLSDAAIAGIVVAVTFVLFLSIFFAYKMLKRMKSSPLRGPPTYVTYQTTTVTEK